MTDILVDNAGPVRRFAASADKAAAQSRLRARYRAEARFRWIGAAAIAVAAVFIVLLFSNILRTGLPAFWQHSILAEVRIDPSLVDPSGKRDPKELRGGDYFAVARATLLEQIPGVTARRDRTKLVQLLSIGAGDALRDRVAADPSLIGQTLRMRLLLSDDADLYFKGEGTAISDIPGAGSAKPNGTTGEVVVEFAARGLADRLAIIKRSLSERGRVLARQADVLAARIGADAPDVVRLRAEAKTFQDRYQASDAEEVLDDTMPSLMLAINGGLIRVTKLTASRAEGEAVLPLAADGEATAGAWKLQVYETPESNRRITDREVAWLEQLRQKGMIENHFNTLFFTAGDSREPELAGLRGAIVGSFLTLLVTLALCLPIGVAAAIYLEEFAPKNAFTDVIEVNISNLAAVPSIVFGLLGLAVFLNAFNLPRSAPLVGGLVLALLVLPTIIIAARAAIRAVPPSIREGALGVGASHQQAVFHHVLPLAMPGIMTGAIIGMAHALGETAPLLMIGMIAFIVDIPGGFTESATVLPVQVYLWSDLPEAAFKAKTAAAIIVLLVFLFVMNGLAVYFRKRFERRW